MALASRQQPSGERPSRRQLSRQHPKDRANDRRSNHRYPVNVAVEYKVVLRNRMVRSGVGRTVNMSSGGILLDSASCLPSGLRIELSMAWPALLNDVAALKLNVVGKTIRTQGNLTALIIRRYEFRTRGKQATDGPSALTFCAGS